METQEYIDQMAEFQEKVLGFIDGDEESLSFEELSSYMNEFGIQEVKKGFYEVIRWLSQLASNHHRTPDFFPRIGQILIYFKDTIKQTLSNYEIFCIFERNKPILLFLIKSEILTPTQQIANRMSNENFRVARYFHYFYPEFKKFITDKKLREDIESIYNDLTKDGFEKFDQKRQRGENDDLLSVLIQNDSIDDFISFINQSENKLNATIEPTIFESNSFLFNKSPTLIEYAAFYGSINIFKYLYLNKADLEPSVWLYAIHGRNPELIHLLEEKKIYTLNFKVTKDLTMTDYYCEAIKCHHNELAEYVYNNLIRDDQLNEDDIRFNSLKYYNYSFFPSDLNSDSIFFDLCQFDYSQLVWILLKTGNININAIKILKIFILLMKFQII